MKLHVIIYIVVIQLANLNTPLIELALLADLSDSFVCCGGGVVLSAEVTSPSLLSFLCSNSNLPVSGAVCQLSPLLWNKSWNASIVHYSPNQNSAPFRCTCAELAYTHVSAAVRAARAHGNNNQPRYTKFFIYFFFTKTPIRNENFKNFRRTKFFSTF